jgi:hypothetical protein
MKDDLQAEMQAYLDNGAYDIQDEMKAYLAEENRKKNVALSEVSYPTTLESKYLQPIYDVVGPVGKGLSILEKPLSLSMGAGRSVGKLISGQENPSGPIMEELKSPFPTPAGSLTADFTEAGIGSEPILGDVLPDYIKQEFPKASGVVENISPNNVIDMAASGAYGASLPKVAKAEALASRGKAFESAKTALIRGSERDLKYVGELKSQGKLETLADKVLTDKAIRRNLNNPEKMVEYLEGIQNEITDKVTGKREKKVILPGKLDEVGSSLQENIKALSRKTKQEPILVDDIVTQITNELIEEGNKVGSGVDFSPEAIKLEINKYLKQPNTFSEFDVSGAATIDVNDLVSIKRGAADKLYEIKSVVKDMDSTSLTKSVADKLWNKANSDIEAFAERVGDYGVIKMNNEYSDYQKIRELYADKNIAAKHIPTLMEQLIPAAAVGAGVGLATGSPYMGLLAGGSYPIARSSIAGLSEKFPSAALNTRMSMVNPALESISRRSSLLTGGVMMLKLPMSAKSAMQDPEMIYSKISRDFGPQAAEMFRNARSEDEVRAIFRMLSQQNPSKFEQTKYDNIDGHIDPRSKQMAIRDIVGDKTSPAHVSADRMQLLLHEGKTDQ